MRTPTMFPVRLIEELHLQADPPPRPCNRCGAQMGHLADFREAGAQPAKRIFLCRACNNILSELR
jgi:hypothetical protein